MSHGSHSRQEATQPPIEAEPNLERSGHFVTPGHTGTSGTSFSGPSIPITGSSTDQTLSSGEIERFNILKDLEKSVDSFRNKSLSKTSAIASILRIIGEDSNVTLTESQKESTFDSYLTEILAIQSSFDENKDPEDPSADPSDQNPSSTSNQPKQIVRRNRDTFDSGDESDGDTGR